MMRRLFSLALTLVSFPLVHVHASLIDYYTLNDANVTPGGGRTDSSGSAFGGGDLVTQTGPGSTTIVSGKIGGALNFPNSLNYTSGAVADLAFPFSLSIWLNTTETGAVTDKALGIEDQAATDRDFSLAVAVSTTPAIPRSAVQVARNTGGPDLTPSAGVADGKWHLLTGVFTSATDRTLYLDGVLAGKRVVSETLWAPNTTTYVNVGGFLRSSGLVDQFNGSLDDAGYFNNALLDSDAALINGLGQTGGIGLDQLALAQALNAAAVGAFSSFGGVTWYKVNGLAGATGVYSGSVAGGDAYIVTDGATGTGLSVVPIPEPSIAGLLGSAVLLGALRRRTRTN